MKKILTLLVLTSLSFFTTNAQLADGSIAPNFTATDLDGNTWTLYDILDQGKTVVLDLSATWCGPCWNYHQGGALESVYEMYGPDGTDEMMVFMVEGDASTNLDCIYDLPGCNSSTYGDWTEGTHYPIINDDNIAGMYELSYWPTIYHICSNRVVTEIPQSGAAAIYAMNDNCAQASGTNNAGILNYTGFDGPFCVSETFAPTAQVQNLGSAEMTSATYEFWLDGSMVESMEWTGSLATFQIEEISFSEVTITDDANYEVQVVSVNGGTDEDDTNNLVSGSASLSEAVSDNYLTLEIQTDNYPGETYWQINDGDGNTFYTGGNALVVGGADASGAYTGAATLYTHSLPLPADGCFEFIIYDAYGDGICCDYGDGFYRITDQAGTVLLEGGEFTDQVVNPFSLEDAGTINDNGAIVFYSGEAGMFCGSYAFAPAVSVQNMGANDITSVTIDVSSPAGNVLTQEWTGNIVTGQTGYIVLDEITLEESTVLDLSIAAINGETDVEDYQNLISTEFVRNYTEEYIWDMELQLGTYAYEIYWQLTNSAGDVMASGGNEVVGPDGGGLRVAAQTDAGAYEPGALITEQFILPADINDCYTFLIVDDWGDGMVDGGGGSLLINSADSVNPVAIVDVDLTTTTFINNNTLIDANPFVLSTGELEAVDNLIIAPNPTSDQLNVSFNLAESMPLQVKIYNVLGQAVQVLANQNFSAGSQQLETNVSDLSNGIYYIHLTNGNQQLTEKFTVINH